MDHPVKSVKLTVRQINFVREYLVDLNATQAAIRAGYSKIGAYVTGCRLLASPKIAILVQDEMDKRAERTRITADKVLRELWNIALADTNEIAEHRRVCCRYCWGVNFKYQYTPAEWEKTQTAYWARVEASKPGVKITPLDYGGGLGFDARKAPHPDCPECNGEGHSYVFVKDTRVLSPALRSLFAGVKQTKDGVEIKMHPKDKALEMLGRHLKLFTDKVEVHDTFDLARRLREARERRLKR